MTTPFRSSAALLALALSASPAAAQAGDTARLAALYDARDCFTLRETLAARPDDGAPETAFYRAFVAGAFNRPDESVAEARRYLEWAGSAPAPGRRVEAETILAENLVRAHRYGEAADVYARLLPEVTDSARRADFPMAVRVFGALRDVPAQTLELSGPLRVPLTRDKAGLVNVPVMVGDTGEHFVFDTGANLSTISESGARAFGFRIIDRPVEAGTASGRNTPGRLAVAPEFRIGAATVRNAVFLVLPDSALAFPQIDYRIHGIVGFPVIAALGEVTLTRAGELVVDPAPASSAGMDGEPNLCLNGLEPLVRVTMGPDTLHFGLDTGAQNSTLFPPFHALRRADVEGRGTERTTRVGGAGGSREMRSFAYGPVTLAVGGREATVARLSVLPERTIERSRYVYGDIGQDVIRQFEAMTLDFRRMQIRFR